jgi:hypothetical protein
MLSTARHNSLIEESIAVRDQTIIEGRSFLTIKSGYCSKLCAIAMLILSLDDVGSPRPTTTTCVYVTTMQFNARDSIFAILANAKLNVYRINEGNICGSLNEISQ